MKILLNLRFLCWMGWHCYTFHHREHLIGRYWTRYMQCQRCGEMTVKGEKV